MTLLSLHADLTANTAALNRIAEALERIAGPVVVDEEPRPIKITDAIGKVDLTGERKRKANDRLAAMAFSDDYGE